MQRLNVAVLALFVVGVLGAGSMLLHPVRAQSPAIDRPGDALYTPTKLEWAALELQANYGETNWTTETPVLTSFQAVNDGKTIRCLLQYTPDVSAENVKTSRDVAQKILGIYAQNRGWSWIRLQFQEQILPRTSR